MKSNDLTCIVSLTSEEERRSVGFIKAEQAEAFVGYAFKQLNVDTSAVPNVETRGANIFPAMYPYSTKSTPHGVFVFDLTETDDGPKILHLYGRLVLTLATDWGVANGYGTKGPAKLRGWAKFLRKEGPTLERSYGMKGTYELGNKTFRTWADLAADMERRADRAEGLATPAQ